jgi:hypothetical protein
MVRKGCDQPVVVGSCLYWRSPRTLTLNTMHENDGYETAEPIFEGELRGWDQAQSSRRPNSIAPLMNGEFLIEINRMSLHGRRGNDKLSGDLLVAVALCQQL